MSKTTNKFSPDVRERAVRPVLDNGGQHGSRRQAVMPIATKIGSSTTMRNALIRAVATWVGGPSEPSCHSFAK